MFRSAALAALLVLLLWASACAPAREASLEEIARSSDEALIKSYEDFLAQRGQLRHADGLDSILVATRYPRRPLSYVDKVNVRLDALELAMEGLTPEDVKWMRTAGLDPFRLDWKTQRIGQAATSELVVAAEVLRTYDTLLPGDGFRSSVELLVKNVLKGEAPGDTLLVRRLSGINRQGRKVTVPGEFSPERDKMYLLFLSNALYDYRLQYPDEEAGERVFKPEEMEPQGRDSLEAARSRYYLQRYPGLRLDWLAAPARAKVFGDVRRAAWALQRDEPDSTQAAPTQN